MEEFKNLLQQVNDIVKSDKTLQEQRRLRGEKYNVFEVLGLKNKEVRLHSAFLAELLNVRGCHGLGDAFLNAFIKTTGIEAFEIGTSGCKTTVEFPIDDGRIDILIRNGDKGIIVENKIYAPDGDKQLSRYATYGKNKFKSGYELIYLTLSGKEASPYSLGELKEENYRRISYCTEIIQWLEECCKIAYNHPFVRESIHQYQALIKQLTHQDMDTEKRGELINLLTKPENIAASLEIYYRFGDIREKIFKDYLLPSMKKIAKELKMEFDSHSESEFIRKDKGFWFSNSNWDSFSIIFIFDSYNCRNFYWTLESDKPFPQKKQNQLPIFKLNTTNNWPYGHSYCEPYRDWNNDTFIDIVNGTFAQIIKTKIKELLKVLRENNIEL